MPFVQQTEGVWRACSTIDLRQLQSRNRFTVLFEVLEEFGYTDQPPDGADSSGATWSREAVDHVVPAGFVTDLASVPVLLWGVIASYGRQTLPAVLHDMLYLAAAGAGSMPRARRLRREADVLFRGNLRETGAGPVRQWLMWAAVRTFGSPVVVVPIITLAVVLLALGVFALGGSLTVPVIAWSVVAVATAGLVAAMVVTAFEAPAGGRTRFRPKAFASLVGAALIALVAMPPMLVVLVITAVVRGVVELGERPVVHVVEEQPVEAVAATARITWSPLLSRVLARGGRIH